MSRKTRNERKRDMKRTACMVFFLILLWTMLCTILVKAWAEEEPVNGVEYLETIGGDPYGNA